MTNISTHGMIENICCWTGSAGAGLSLNWSHIVTPSRIGRIPKARKLGGVKSRKPNRLTGVSGSGAERSLIHSANGWWRISTLTISTL